MWIKRTAILVILIAVVAMAWFAISGDPADTAGTSADPRSPVADAPEDQPDTTPTPEAPVEPKPTRATARIRLIDAIAGSTIGDIAVSVDGTDVAVAGDGSVQVVRGKRRRDVHISAPGYVPRRVSIAAFETGPEDVPLFPTATLIGTVYDGEGWPLADAAVRLLNARGRVAQQYPGYTSLPLFWSARSDPRGEFQRRDLPAAIPLNVRIRTSAGGQITSPQPLVLKPAEIRRVAFRAKVSGVVRGTVRDQHGRPIAGAKVSVTENPTQPNRISHGPKTTGDDGRFTFGEVACGSARVAVAPRKRGPHHERYPQLRVPFELGSAERVIDLTVTVHRGLYVRGVVRGFGGEAIRGAVINSEIAFYRKPRAQSGKDGLFTLGPLPEGAFAIRAIRTGRYLTSKPVRVRGGDTGIVLEMPLAARITGIAVAGATDKPVECKIEAMRRGDASPKQWATSVSSGKFDLPGLAPGRYDLVAHGVGVDARFVGALHGIEVTEGSEHTNVRLRLEPGGTIQLEVTDTRKPEDKDDDARRGNYRCYVERHGLLVSPFSTSYPNGAKIPVPSGTVRVFLTSRSWKLEQTVDVPPGQRVPVRFTLE